MRQYRNPIILPQDAGQGGLLGGVSDYVTVADAETAINGVLSDNPGYCLIGSVGMEPTNSLIFDEDWGVSNPIHEVVLVELTTGYVTQLATALADNPDFRFVGFLSLPGASANAFILGRS